MNELKFTLRTTEKIVNDLTNMAKDHVRSVTGEIVNIILEAIEEFEQEKDKATKKNKSKFEELIYFRIDKDIMEKFKKIAKAHGNSVNTELNKVISEALDKHNNKR